MHKKWLVPNVQGNRQTRITEVEENQENREREGANNLFGEVVDNCKLDKMSRYMGKKKTQEDRVREACYLIGEDGKDVKASRYVKSLKAMYGNAKSTLCLLYNATGDTLYHVTDHEWYGQIGGAPYPTEIGNGQWAAFHHVHKIAEPSGSVAAVVYRGKNTEGQSQDYLVAWYIPWGLWCCNKAYCEIGCVDYFHTLGQHITN